MQKEKNIVLEALEEKKKEEIDRFAKLENDICSCESIEDLFMMFVEIYGNTTRQGEHMIQFIKENFKEDFFQLAEAKIESHYISFTHEALCIMFPKTQAREIHVFNRGGIKKPKEVQLHDQEFLDLVESCRTYLRDNSKENRRILTTRYLNYYMWKKSNLPLKNWNFTDRMYIDKIWGRLKQNGIRNMLEEFELAIAKREKEVAKYQEELSAYKEERQKVEILFDTLDSMKLFNNEKWFFFFVDMDCPDWVVRGEKSLF